MSEVKAREIKLVDLDLLVENPKNNNRHPDAQIERLAKLIKHTGFRNPLVVSSRSGFVLCGHGRIAAAKLAGLSAVPVIYQDFRDEAEEYAYMTADNAIAAWAEIDMEMVAAESMNIEGLDIEMLGLKEFNIAPLEKFEMEDELREDMNKKFILEINFPNDMEMMDIHDDLVSRGYIVKVKNK